MNELTTRDRELVALGAAIAANCIPCVEYHIPKAREAGISEGELGEVIALADKVRQVPAKKVLATAREALKGAADPAGAGAGTASNFERCSELMRSTKSEGSCC